MHFGEYLVQKKILSPHQILKALAEQQRRRSFIPLLLVELGALPDYRVLKYFTDAAGNNEDFLQVLVRERVISTEQAGLIEKTWMRSGPPLGSLLVEMGLVDEGTKETALEEFEAEKSLEANLANILS